MQYTFLQYQTLNRINICPYIKCKNLKNIVRLNPILFVLLSHNLLIHKLWTQQYNIIFLNVQKILKRIKKRRKKSFIFTHIYHFLTLFILFSRSDCICWHFPIAWRTSFSICCSTGNLTQLLSENVFISHETDIFVG